jgi:hypothetical protein
MTVATRCLFAAVDTPSSNNSAVSLHKCIHNIRLFINNRLFNQELTSKMGDIYGR